MNWEWTSGYWTKYLISFHVYLTKRLTSQITIENNLKTKQGNNIIRHLNVEMSGRPIKSGYYCKLISNGVPQTKQTVGMDEVAIQLRYIQEINCFNENHDLTSVPPD